MGVVIEGSYLGNKRTRLVHGPSGSEILTDAPRDNGGQGAYFSPTDMVAASLGACIMTILGLIAERDNLDLSGMTMRVEKTMSGEPRRIGRLQVDLRIPGPWTPEQRRKFENAAHTCPVHHSLHPEIDVQLNFLYDERRF